MNRLIHEDLKYATEDKIQEILDGGINGNNIDALGELVDIHKDIANEKYWCKKEENMYKNYGGYYEHPRMNTGYNDIHPERMVANIPRGRGYDYLDRMSDYYGRYDDGHRRYGVNEDTKRSLKYMLDSMEDFARMLKEDAKSQEEVEMIRATAQRIAQM